MTDPANEYLQSILGAAGDAIRNEEYRQALDLVTEAKTFVEELDRQ